MCEIGDGHCRDDLKERCSNPQDARKFKVQMRLQKDVPDLTVKIKEKREAAGNEAKTQEFFVFRRDIEPMRAPYDSHCYENKCHQRQQWQRNHIARAPVFTNGLVISFAERDSDVTTNRDTQTQIGETEHAHERAHVEPKRAKVSAQV